MQIVPVPAVNAALINSEGEVLFTLRSQTVREPGKWCLPGGHLEMGETWQTAIEREIQEEIGVKIKKYRLSGIYSDPKLTITAEPVSDGYHAQFIVLNFLVTAWEGEISPNDEVEDWDWFDIQNIPEPILKSHPIRAMDAKLFSGTVMVR